MECFLCLLKTKVLTLFAVGKMVRWIWLNCLGSGNCCSFGEKYLLYLKALKACSSVGGTLGHGTLLKEVLHWGGWSVWVYNITSLPTQYLCFLFVVQI